MRHYNNYGSYNDYPDYYEKKVPSRGVLDAIRMRKLLTFAMVCLCLFFVGIEMELSSLQSPLNKPLRWIGRLGRLRRKRRHSRAASPVDEEEIFDSDIDDRRVSQTPSGFIPTWSGEYKVKLFHSSPDFKEWNFHDVSIATQCSANRLFNIKELADRWDGPISVAVFIPGEEAGFAIDAIDGLKACWPETVGSRTSFHLAFPSNVQADVSGRGSLTKEVYKTCDNLLKLIENYGEANYEHDIPYPHNVLRNAARNGVTTEFVFLIDVDVLPSTNLRTQFMDYAGRTGLLGNKNDNRVYVVPVFEIRDGYAMPKTKKALLDANADGMVRPFHNQTCVWCHRPEEHNKWLRLPDIQPKLLSSGFIATWEKSWEPFYIGRRNVPLFDERFKQYGFDRQEQICELHLSGYDFVVLDKAFLVHRGWKEKTKSERQKETYRNWILFNFHFHQMLLRIYKEGGQSCAPIEKWEPRGQKMKDEIAARKAIFKQHTIYDVLEGKHGRASNAAMELEDERSEQL